jgi:hypothetical protein
MGAARLIAWKDGVGSSLLVDPREFDCLDKVSRLNENATSVHDLYPDGTTTCGERSIWDDMIAAPARADTQRELKEAIRSVEAGGGEPDTPPTTPQLELHLQQRHRQLPRSTQQATSSHQRRSISILIIVKCLGLQRIII